MTAPSILIIDDEPDLLELFRAALRKLRYRVVTANRGDTAWQMMQEDEPPVLIILDVAMPYPDGLDLLRVVRADARFDATRVMILTAVPSRVSKDDAALIDVMMSKPVTPRALEQAVVNLIGV